MAGQNDVIVGSYGVWRSGTVSITMAAPRHRHVFAAQVYSSCRARRAEFHDVYIDVGSWPSGVSSAEKP